MPALAALGAVHSAYVVLLRSLISLAIFLSVACSADRVFKVAVHPQAQAARDAHGQEARARLLVQAPPGPRVVRAGVPQGELRIKLEGVGGSVLSLSNSIKTKKLVVDERSALLLRILFFSVFLLVSVSGFGPSRWCFLSRLDLEAPFSM